MHTQTHTHTHTNTHTHVYTYIHTYTERVLFDLALTTHLLPYHLILWYLVTLPHTLPHTENGGARHPDNSPIDYCYGI